MKRNYICLFLFLIATCLFSIVPVKANLPLSGKVFIIDAGHGGVDPGTVVGKVYEKDINLQITLALRNELARLGASVMLTREGDYDLGTPRATYRKKSDFDHRISYINHSNANYFISIHLNYLSDSSYFGPQVFYNNRNEENKALALQVQEYLNSKLNTHREIKKLSNTIYMYSKLDKPGVLVECGFLSNASERKKLLDETYINQFAKYLAESFVKI